MPDRGRPAQSLPAHCPVGHRRPLQEGLADRVRLCWQTHTCIATSRKPIRVAEDTTGVTGIADELTDEVNLLPLE